MSARQDSSAVQAGGAGRRGWLRALAIVLGLLVFFAHVVTLRLPAAQPSWWPLYWPDLAKHISLISAFALAYRLSYLSPGARTVARTALSARDGGHGGPPHHGGPSHRAAPDPVSADLATVLVCSGWAALCEILQNWIPAREFSPLELAANALTPVLVIAVLRWLSGWRGWFS